VRRTTVPFGVTGVFLTLVGAAVAACASGAHTLGQALHRLATTAR